MMRISGFIFGGAICTVTIAQYIVYVWMLNSIFRNVNEHLLALIICENEEQHLETSACILSRQNKVNIAQQNLMEMGVII